MLKEMDPFLVLFILVVIPSICKGLHAGTCNVVPKDQYIEVGSDTEVVCQTSCLRGNRGKVFWTLNNRPIDKSLSNTINSSHTVLTLKAFTHHNATLQCHSADTQQILGGTTIRTYSKPSKLSCIWEYENEDGEGVPQLFKCNWEQQITSSLKINYTVLYKSQSAETEIKICESNATNCTSRNSTICAYENGTVTVRATTVAWETYSNPFEFDPNNIRKISRPTLENVTAFSDQLLVEWTPSVVKPVCRCQVKYGKVVSNGTVEESVINRTLDSCQSWKEIIQNVESCSNYTISVRCALDKAPWSNWSQEKTVITKLNKRDAKLRLWRKVVEPEKNEIRKVRAMWTEIPSTCQDTFNYTIKLALYKDHMTGVSYTDILCGSSTCDVHVNQDAHRINLTVYQNENLLVEDSVYVPATGESLPQVTDIENSTHDGVILVSWKAPVQPVSGYMIDWTHNGNQYYWKESKHTNTTLFDLLDKKPYNITVTPLFDDKTGHGTQAFQVCSREGDPGVVTINKVEPNAKSALVSWNIESREECSSAAINYTVVYGPQNGPMFNVTVDSTKQDIDLKDLNPDTQYSVYVKATALTGSSSKSSERLFKTKRFDPGLLITLSVCGSIIIVFVFPFGLFCASQWKKFSEKPVPNPGLSSVALWSSPNHQKGMCSFQPFSNPSDSLFDQVYTEETQRTLPPPLSTGWNSNPAIETEEYTDPTIVLAPDVQNEKPVETVETQYPCSPGESTALLSSENSQFNPYRSQSSVETPASTCKRVPVKQLEKTAPVTIYVTLDMFEQGQAR